MVGSFHSVVSSVSNAFSVLGFESWAYLVRKRTQIRRSVFWGRLQAQRIPSAGVYLIISGLLFGVVESSAHHAFSWEFDAKKPVTVSGVVTKVEWVNPHAYFYVDVKDGEGRAVNWIFETAGPNTLDRRGWHRDSIRKGDQITVLGFQARSAPNIASARLIVLHDGRKVIVGSPGDGGP